MSTTDPTPSQGTSQHQSKEVVEASYDAIASTYLTWTNNTPSPRLKYLSKLLPLLPPNPSVLELGCGAGVPGTQFLLQHGCTVIGNDISASQLALAEKHVPGAKLVKGDMMSLDFAPGSLDAVVGLYSVLHLPREEQVELLERVKGWLKVEGVFLGNFAGAVEENPGGSNVWLDGKEMFWSSWGLEGNREMVKGRGLSVLEEKVEVDVEDGREVKFWWVIARKT